MASRAMVANLPKTLTFLLRNPPAAGGVARDEQGWSAIDELADAASKVLRREITADAIRDIAGRGPNPPIEIARDRVRSRRRKTPRKVTTPDILYHAVFDRDLEKARSRKHLRGPQNRPLILSDDEAAAWRVVHRRKEPGQVLIVDSTRARRHGVKFRRHRRGNLFSAERIPLADVLNLQKNYGEQVSAGGLPLIVEDGVCKVALIRVSRRSGVTWEVAKGKLEPGETPESAAVREVREEMGIETELEVTGFVGVIRYGFLAPGGLPRLKSVYLYTMQPVGEHEVVFTPREAEGIGDVRWFPLDEACHAVTHTSLRPIMVKARDQIAKQFKA